jgi:hypothetical protein
METVCFSNVVQTADSDVYVGKGLNLCADGTTSLDLGGYTLSVMAPSSAFRLYNCDVINGTIVISNSVAGSTSTLTLANGIRADSVSLVVGDNASFAPYGDASFGNLTIGADCYYQEVTPGVTSVGGVFTPLTDKYQNVRLLDGSTLSLKDFAGTFSMVNPDHSDRTVTFASGANVTVNLAGRTDLATLAASESPYVATWTAMPDANFAVDAATAGARYKVRKDATGLRLVRCKGTMIMVK